MHAASLSVSLVENKYRPQPPVGMENHFLSCKLAVDCNLCSVQLGPCTSGQNSGKYPYFLECFLVLWKSFCGENDLKVALPVLYLTIALLWIFITAICLFVLPCKLQLDMTEFVLLTDSLVVAKMNSRVTKTPFVTLFNKIFFFFHVKQFYFWTKDNLMQLHIKHRADHPTTLNL